MQTLGSRVRSGWSTLHRQYKIMTSNTYGLIGFWVVAFFFAVALFAPLLAPYPVWEMQYDAETGQTGKVIQRFEHPDQFRCIGYQSSIYHLLGGTEQGGVLSFALSRSLLPEDKQHLVPSDEKKEDDIALARLDDEEAELLVELGALSDSD